VRDDHRKVQWRICSFFPAHGCIALAHEASHERVCLAVDERRRADVSDDNPVHSGSSCLTSRAGSDVALTPGQPPDVPVFFSRRSGSACIGGGGTFLQAVVIEELAYAGIDWPRAFADRRSYLLAYGDEDRSVAGCRIWPQEAWWLQSR
jgi:hypothetical protein